MSWDLSPDELELTREKIAKINARAAKRGFTGRLDVVAEPVERKRDVAGIKITEMFYATSITGEPPSYNGWTLLASLDWTESGVIVNTAPGVDKIDREALEPGKCDHCGINRYRKNAYVVADGTRQLQVGSTCIKDFLGWSGSVQFISTEEMSEEIGGFYGSGERTYAIESALAVAWAVVTEFGFVRSSDPGATREKVSVVLDPGRSVYQRELAARIRPLAEDALPMANKLIEWVKSDEFAGDNEYVQNLKVLCSGETVAPKHFGLLASIPQAYARHLERTFIRERERAETVNEWVGSEKDKLELNVKIKAIRWIEGFHGTTTLYTFLSDTGHTFKWFASSSAFGDEVTPENGDSFKIRGTVKTHDEYNGHKSTVLTRCKKI